MNKTELKAAWGKYCDTDKLVDNAMKLLTKCNHRNSEHGVCTMLNEYFKNKKELIETLMSSPNYHGDMRIMVDIELERTNDKRSIQHFCQCFQNRMRLRELFVKKVDEHGKMADDYYSVGVKSFDVKDLFNEEFLNIFIKNANNRNKFDNNGELIESVNKFSLLNQLFIYGFGANCTSTINGYTAHLASKLTPPVKLTEGMKTSRAFNKVCTEYGIDKAYPIPSIDLNGNEKVTYPYDKLFAEYSDMVTGSKRKLKFFISVNPLDYLTMSFGVNWTSCHNIQRHGGWCGGCVSYMLDSSSIITYVHTDVPETIEEGKIYRNMFHYKNGAILQSRIYPQENDGQTNLYNEFWKVFTKEFSPLIGVNPDSWTKRNGDYSAYTKTTGIHYPDYTNYDRYSFRYTNEIDGADRTIIPIGHKRICTYCGQTTDDFNRSATAHNNCHI